MNPDNDKWELDNLDDDWSQAHDLAEKMPQKLAELKEVFLIELAKNNGFRSGAASGFLSSTRSCRVAAVHRVDIPRRNHADA